MSRTLSAVGLSTALSTISVTALADSAGSYEGMHMWEGSGYGWIMGPVMMIVFLAVAVAVVVLVVRGLTGSAESGNVSTPSRTDKSPQDILAERFARGEIDKQEYEERRRVLDS